VIAMTRPARFDTQVIQAVKKGVNMDYSSCSAALAAIFDDISCRTDSRPPFLNIAE
jgi:hypothetical protein